jgi:hypothetical protein
VFVWDFVFLVVLTREVSLGFGCFLGKEVCSGFREGKIWGVRGRRGLSGVGSEKNDRCRY